VSDQGYIIPPVSYDGLETAIDGKLLAESWRHSCDFRRLGQVMFWLAYCKDSKRVTHYSAPTLNIATPCTCNLLWIADRLLMSRHRQTSSHPADVHDVSLIDDSASGDHAKCCLYSYRAEVGEICTCLIRSAFDEAKIRLRWAEPVMSMLRSC
jgi:hypothetical protein